MKKFVAAVALSAAVIAAPAFAKTDGVLSTSTSTGTVDIKTVIPPMVRISGLEDVNIDITPAALTSPYFSTVDTTSKYCVYSNVNASGDYSITASGAGSNGQFTLAGTNGTTLNYAMYVSDDANNAFRPNGTGLIYNGQTKTGYKTTAGGQARATTLNCSNVGGKNASMIVRLQNSDLLAAQAGTYTGTLTLTVSAI